MGDLVIGPRVLRVLDLVHCTTIDAEGVSWVLEGPDEPDDIAEGLLTEILALEHDPEEAEDVWFTAAGGVFGHWLRVAMAADYRDASILELLEPG